MTVHLVEQSGDALQGAGVEVGGCAGADAVGELS